MSGRPLSWIGIVRIGLVQTALGAVVILTTSTINRVMIVELALAAVVPGALVTIHYALQLLRPRWGYGSDIGGRRTPWIVGGMATLAAGGFAAALAVAIYPGNAFLGLAVATAAFFLVGIGVGAAGTTLLVLLAKSVDEKRRGPAATVVWIMMIGGFIVTAGAAGQLLDPFSPQRLLAVSGTVSVLALAVTCLAVWGVERSAVVETSSGEVQPPHRPFGKTLAEVWGDPQARHFTIFVFVSMLAYSAQDLILEPFAGLAFGYTPGQSTALAGIQNAGVLGGMVLVGALSSLLHRNRAASLRNWTAFGCAASAVSLACLAAAAAVGPAWPLKLSVFMLGFTNGIFAVAAIGCMFSYAVMGERREGMRMGLFGAAQAIAFGLGGLAGAAFADIARYFTGSAAAGYGAVFAGEALMFLAAALLALRIGMAKDTGGTLENPLTLAARHQTQG